jgi:FkbM family methyltransferase
MVLLAYWNDSNFCFEEIGERHLLSVLGRAFNGLQAFVLDVGAHKGAYAQKVIEQWPGAEIHGFEILTRISKGRLTHKYEESGGIVWNEFGLSSEAREINVLYLPNGDSGSGVTSLHAKSAIPTLGPVATGDSYPRSRDIDEVALLKVDVEGHDLEVLKGFSRALTSGNIAVIQFEYGITAGPARCDQGDFYDFLEPAAYRIGRLYPDGVAFADYSPALDESHIMGNYVAVKKEHSDLIASLVITKDSIFLPRDAR